MGCAASDLMAPKDFQQHGHCIRTRLFRFAAYHIELKPDNQRDGHRRQYPISDIRVYPSTRFGLLT